MPVLTFDNARHEYRLDGAVIPGVTRLLWHLHSFAGVSREVLDAASERGTAVHIACQLWDEDNLDGASVDQAIAGYVEAWKQFTRDFSPNWRHIETRGFHPTLRYAGTVDRAGVIDGRMTVLDIKTGAPHPVWGIQTAAYAQMLGMPSARRATVKLNDDGTYRLRPWNDPTDWPAFCSLVTLNSWKERNA